MTELHIYTDGACEGNQFSENYGGWGVVIIHENQEILTLQGAARNTTNNRMELFAVIKSLEYLQNEKPKKPSLKAIIHSDSAYIVNCINQKWYINWQKRNWTTSKKTIVKNQDLWKKLLKNLSGLNISFQKVKAHVGNKYNEQADFLAVNAIKKQFNR